MTDDERLFKKESSQVVSVTERLDSKTPPQTPQPPSNQDVRNMFETALRNFAFYSRKMQFSDDDIHVTLKFIRCPSQVTKKAVSFQNADAVSSEAVFASRWLTRLLEYDRAVRKSTVVRMSIYCDDVTFMGECPDRCTKVQYFIRRVFDVLQGKVIHSWRDSLR